MSSYSDVNAYSKRNEGRKKKRVEEKAVDGDAGMK
jgi:hypothetical protein